MHLRNSNDTESRNFYLENFHQKWKMHHVELTIDLRESHGKLHK